MIGKFGLVISSVGLLMASIGGLYAVRQKAKSRFKIYYLVALLFSLAGIVLGIINVTR